MTINYLQGDLGLPGVPGRPGFDGQPVSHKKTNTY